MNQLLAWTGSADSTIISEAVMAMAEKFNTGQEVCLQIPSARGVMQVKEGTSGSRATFEPCPLFVCSTLTLLTESLHCRELAVCAKETSCAPFKSAPASVVLSTSCRLSPPEPCLFSGSAHAVCRHRIHY